MLRLRRFCTLVGPKSASHCLVFTHKCPVFGWPPPHVPLSLLCSKVPHRKALLMPCPHPTPTPTPTPIRAPLSPTVSVHPHPNLPPRRSSLRAGPLDSKANPPSLHVRAGPQEITLNLQPRPELQLVTQQEPKALHSFSRTRCSPWSNKDGMCFLPGHRGLSEFVDLKELGKFSRAGFVLGTELVASSE